MSAAPGFEALSADPQRLETDYDAVDPRQAAFENTGLSPYAVRASITGVYEDQGMSDRLEQGPRVAPFRRPPRRGRPANPGSDRDVQIATELSDHVGPAERPYEQLAIPGIHGPGQAQAHKIAAEARAAGAERSSNGRPDILAIAREARRARQRR